MAYLEQEPVALNPFSPWRNRPDTLLRTLVGRDHVVRDILEKVTRFAAGAPPKHCLLIAPRGLGKTHILSLLFNCFDGGCTYPSFKEIARDLLPVFILEEERYSIHSLTALLMSVFEKFSEQTGAGEEWAIPPTLDEDSDIIEYCLEKIKEYSAASGKKIILLCDNLEEIFHQWHPADFKRLRAFLSDQEALMLIGSAVRIFNEIVHPEQPFYEFFETVPLYDLDRGQMLELFRLRFREDGQEEEFNRKEKELEGKLAAISTLTGGNPRLVVFSYDIATKKNVFEIERAVDELMESLSEYFRGRYERLAPQERTILDAFARMEGPATPTEIMQKTRFKKNSTHAYIKKLKDAGYIEPLGTGKRRITRYDVTERLFRIWRQTATVSGKRRFKIFVQFLKLYFTPDEVRKDFLYSVEAFKEEWQQNRPERKKNLIHYLSYLAQMEATNNKDEFIIYIQAADTLVKDAELREMLKPYIYAGKYLKDGDPAILEEVFPEVRDVIEDIVGKFEKP